MPGGLFHGYFGGSQTFLLGQLAYLTSARSSDPDAHRSSSIGSSGLDRMCLFEMRKSWQVGVIFDQSRECTKRGCLSHAHAVLVVLGRLESWKEKIKVCCAMEQQKRIGEQEVIQFVDGN